MDINTLDLKYIVLPSRLSGPNPPIQSYNKIYTFWKNLWSKTLEKQNLPPLDRDEFLRQDLVCAIMYKNEVIACHLYSNFDTRSQLTFECSYFSQISEELKSYCDKHGINSIQTQEYLAVSPRFRKSTTNFSLPEIVISLGIHIMKETGCESAGGTIREDAGSVNRIGKEIGGHILGSTITKYGINHKFFIVKENQFKRMNSPTTQNVIDRLWNERIDYSYLSHNNQPTIAA